MLEDCNEQFNEVDEKVEVLHRRMQNEKERLLKKKAIRVPAVRKIDSFIDTESRKKMARDIQKQARAYKNVWFI